MDLLLRDLRDGAAETLEATLEAFAPGAPRERLIEDVQAICRALHTTGVSMLLVEGKPQEYFLDLCRAAENWRRLLEHLRGRELEAPPASYLAPLYGAMAAGEWELARGVAVAVATRWQPGEEYEDDFDWAALIHRCVAGAGQAQLAPYVGSLRRSGQEAYGERLEVLQAIWSGDREAFLAAFRAVLAVHGEDMEEAVQSFNTGKLDLAPYRFVWLEGLALLRLAEEAGLETSSERFLYCPPLARVRRTVEYQRDQAIPAGLAR
jgi:hypothetical protein